MSATDRRDNSMMIRLSDAEQDAVLTAATIADRKPADLVRYLALRAIATMKAPQATQEEHRIPVQPSLARPPGITVTGQARAVPKPGKRK